MSRRARPHLPKTAFHLTARTQSREQLFGPEIRTRIVSLVRTEIGRSDAQLLAYAVMPNHLHLVVLQGSEPLGVFMQTLLRRIALHVQRLQNRQGHIFERRFRDQSCGDPDYLRNAISYVHLNPMRAGIETQLGDYPWTSHGAYVGLPLAIDGLPDPAEVDVALPLFSVRAAQDRDELQHDYVTYVRWRMQCDAYRDAAETGDDAGAPPYSPPCAHGDRHWRTALVARPGGLDAKLLAPARSPVASGGGRMDLRDVVLGTLRDAGAEDFLYIIRSRYGGPRVVELRRAVIRAAAAAGYRGVQIATYLRISEQAVSRTLARTRKAQLGIPV